ncbi:hypothetical protein PS683_03741 [Pseudomonas fluorescens]|uniref:Uncharacterized protein n=1 Tax=Pseudomonas fluorescens TaxID=294 RepID=A0A5E6MVD9_PSEFL|nr:hypothetical protein PS683_03741 [Pseudomonas fluorescens]VVN08955.1 hypothetical protein PS683_03741 [Pseudomonas fluorescens]
MHKCIFYGECILVGMKKPAFGGLEIDVKGLRQVG